jgi:hypothetical protein
MAFSCRFAVNVGIFYERLILLVHYAFSAHFNAAMTAVVAEMYKL